MSTQDLLRLVPATPRHTQVPRAIFMAWDDFGLRVLDQLQKPLDSAPSQLLKWALTGYVRLNQLTLAEAADLSSSELLRLLEDRLARGRGVTSAAMVQSGLLEQGYQIGPQLELYVVVELTSSEQVQGLEAIVRTARAFLQRFEPLLLTVVINLAGLPEAVAAGPERVQSIRKLDALLALQYDSANPDGAAYLMDRCYVVTRETASGKTSLDASSLTTRVALFLALHCQDAVRQSSPTYHPLFLRTRASEVLDPDDHSLGLCDLFGVAGRKFDLHPVLEWCAWKQTGYVLGEVLLRSQQAERNLPSWWPDLVDKLEETLSVDGLSQALIQQIRDAIPLALVALQREQFTLSSWRQAYKQLDARLQGADREVEIQVQTLQSNLKSFLAGGLDRCVVDWPFGRALADEWLNRVEAALREGIRQLDTDQVDAPVATDLLQEWRRLASTTIQSSGPLTLWSRMGLSIWLMAVAVLLGGMVLPLLSGLTVVAGTVWLLEAYIWFPRRQVAAAQRFQTELAAWRDARISTSVRLHLARCLRDLVDDDPQEAPSWTRQEGVSLRRWQHALNVAIEECDQRLQRDADTTSSIQGATSMEGAPTRFIQVEPAEKACY